MGCGASSKTREDGNKLSTITYNIMKEIKEDKRELYKNTIILAPNQIVKEKTNLQSSSSSNSQSLITILLNHLSKNLEKKQLANVTKTESCFVSNEIIFQSINKILYLFSTLSLAAFPFESFYSQDNDFKDLYNNDQKVMGILANNSIDYFMIELSCLSNEIILANLSTLLKEEKLIEIINTIELRFIAVDQEGLKIIKNIINKNKLEMLKGIMIIGEAVLSKEDQQIFSKHNINIFNLNQSIAKFYNKELNEGLSNNSKRVKTHKYTNIIYKEKISNNNSSTYSSLFKRNSDFNDNYLLISEDYYINHLDLLNSIYSSSNTVKSEINNYCDSFFRGDEIYYSFNSLGETFEKIMAFNNLLAGNKIGFSSSLNKKSIFSEMNVLQPTLCCFDSSTLLFLNKQMKLSFEILPDTNYNYLQSSIDNKRSQIRNDKKIANSFLDSNVFKNVRENFGNQLKTIFYYKGNLSREEVEDFSILASIPVVNIYYEEAKGVLSYSQLNDFNFDNNGALFSDNVSCLVLKPYLSISNFMQTNQNTDVYEMKYELKHKNPVLLLNRKCTDMIIKTSKKDFCNYIKTINTYNFIMETLLKLESKPSLIFDFFIISYLENNYMSNSIESKLNSLWIVDNSEFTIKDFKLKIKVNLSPTNLTYFLRRNKFMNENEFNCIQNNEVLMEKCCKKDDALNFIKEWILKSLFNYKTQIVLSKKEVLNININGNLIYDDFFKIINLSSSDIELSIINSITK